MGHREHKAGAPSSVRCAVVTVSDTRTPDTDSSGALIQELLRGAGHKVTDYRIVKDDPSLIRDVIQKAPNETQAIILTGGTGISKRDGTYEVVSGLLEKTIEGFGELFRALSYEEIGSAAMMSRATAGLHQGKVIFSVPGSKAAVRLAMEKLILPELGHCVRELSS